MQTPFTTIGIGTETSWEGRLVQKAVLRNRTAGFGKGKKRTAIFPKISFATCPGHNMNPGDVNYDVYKEVLKCMAKAIYPDILFVTKEQIDNGTVVYGMGCRAYLSPWFNEKGEEIYNGRFNLGATTINLPKIAINAKGDVKAFYKELDEVLQICRDNCLFRAKYMEDTPSDIAPILWQSGALAELKPGETIKDLVWGGYATISIGYIGLSEVSRLLFGKDFSEDDKVYKDTFAILSYIKGKIDYFKKEDNLGYALYATPSESLCDRFAKNDLDEYGSIEGITDKGYYENSFHVASNIQIDPFRKMKLEGKAHGISTGGHISYIEAPNLTNNLDAVESLIRMAFQCDVHYFGINQPIDHCFLCGFKGEFKPTTEGYECPHCGNHDSSTISVIRRVCGYLSQPDARPFNNGKQKEVINRVNHYGDKKLSQDEETKEDETHV